MKPFSDNDTDTTIADEAAANPVAGIDQEAGNFQYDVKYDFDAGSGLSEDTVNFISQVKKEPEWIREFRQKALKIFESKPLPTHW
ncbi:MAG TPA: Fe-S cluster assembly protein SufB, partial [Opitutaceae bacterium]